MLHVTCLSVTINFNLINYSLAADRCHAASMLSMQVKELKVLLFIQLT